MIREGLFLLSKATPKHHVICHPVVLLSRWGSVSKGREGRRPLPCGGEGSASVSSPVAACPRVEALRSLLTGSGAELNTQGFGRTDVVTFKLHDLLA